MFISYFQKISDKIDFDYKKFNDEYLSQLSPAKMTIGYLDQEKKTAYQLRDAIIINLGLNYYFYKDIHETSMYKYIYRLVKETEDGVKTDDQVAQLTLTFHFSKSLIEDKSTWNFFFELLPSLTIINNPDLDFKTDLVNLFDRIKSSERISQRIKFVITSIIGFQEISFNLDNLTLNLFNFNDYRLNGFAGIHGLFISLNSIEIFMKTLPTKFDNKQRLEIFSLNMTRLIVNETCHVILRKALNDFNASSPYLSTDKQSSSQLTKFKSIEAGINAEKKIFSERICWNLSAIAPNFDLTYCTDFLNKLIDLPVCEQYPVDFPFFDFKRSGCVLNTSRINYMAIDFEEEMEFL